jgi:WD40 repeat protein
MKKVAIIIGLLATSLKPVIAQNPIHFNAKGIVVLSDADLAASSLVDGKLIEDKIAKDQLTTIKFPLQRGVENLGRISLPNSVLGFARSIAVSNNGKFAYALESYSTHNSESKEGADVAAAEERIYVVDLENMSRPMVKYAFAVGNNATALDMNNNDIVLVTNKKGKELVCMEAGADGKPTYYQELTIGLEEHGFISHAMWHPSGDYIVLGFAKSHEVALYKLIREAGKIKSLEAVGNRLKLSGTPGFGKFSKDGKKFFVLDSKGSKGKTAGTSEINVVDFSFDGSKEHRIVTKIPSGENTGSFAMSPDGKLLVTANAGKSVTAWTSGGTATGSFLTLYRVGGDVGLTKVVDYPFEGIYPQSVMFDKDGANLAVSVYEYADYGNTHGAVEFWSVTKGEFPELKKQNAKINVMKGAHTLRAIL